MSRKNSLAKLMQQQTHEKIAKAIELAGIRQLDFVTIALGRMGWKEPDFRKLDEVLTQVSLDYNELLVDDYYHDQEYVYSHTKIDQELAMYTGKFFKPFVERYGFE